MQDQLLSHVQTAISFVTTAGQNSQKKEYMDWLQTAFFSSLNQNKITKGEHEGSPYLLSTHPAPQLLWFAHFDVVPAEPHQFSLKIEGDKAFGRGVKDMKGASLPFLFAYREALERGEDPPVSVLCTSDEETAGSTIPMLLEKGLLDVPVAFTPDTGMTPHIVVEHKGVAWAELTANGKGSHGAAPWDGENPILLLSKALTTIADNFPSGTADDWQMTVSPTMLKGSSAQNQVPDNATCLVDIRFPPELCSSPEQALERVSAVLPKGCTLKSRIMTNPLKTDPAHPMVLFIKRIAEEVTGEDVPVGREHGATDARYFSSASIPAFLYGPLGGDIHGSNEWVSIPSLLEHYEMSRKLLKEL